MTLKGSEVTCMAWRCSSLCSLILLEYRQLCRGRKVSVPSPCLPRHMVEGSGTGFLVQGLVAHDSVWLVAVEEAATGVALVC